jgi:hypothetical protein
MGQALTLGPIEEVIAFLSQGPSRKEIAAFRLSEEAQQHIRALLRKNSAGTLTPEEDHELDQMVLLDEIVSLIRARAQRPTRAQSGAVEDIESTGA